tara:strand:- start:919 stop:1815 length:897 start_codon:yes stop_codon:yes gene_type:complete
MIIKILFSLVLISTMSAQNAFSGLSALTHGGTVGYSGGGYLLSFQNEFRNAAMLVDAERTVQLSLVSYPAEIIAQSAIINGKIKNHHLGFTMKNINYGIFESRTADNVLTGSFSANDTHIQIGYGRFIYKDKIIAGLNSGLFFSQFEKTNASLITMSPSALLLATHFSAAITIEHYGKVLDYYTSHSEHLSPSVVFSLHRTFNRYPLELEFSSVSSSDTDKRVYRVSALYKPYNNIYFKGGVSSNIKDRISGDQFRRNLFNDMGFGVGYAFDNIILDCNTFTYSDSHSIFSIAISSKF